MKIEDVKKSIEAIVEEAVAKMSAEAPAEEKVEKSVETPADEKNEEEKVTMAKSDKSSDEASKGAEKEFEEANGGDSEKVPGKPAEKTTMKKSLEELKDILTEDELEVITAWRQELGEEPVAKSFGASDIAKAVNDAVSAQLDDLKKALSAKDDLIKSLNEKIDRISAAPAYQKRSVDGLEIIEKSASEEEPLNKSQVLDVMLDLQKAGKGVTSLHIAEFESTSNISNPQVRQLVMNSCKR